MPATRKSVPSYLKHSASGRARAVWADHSGTRRDQLLPGPFNSKESRSAFARLVLELDAAPHTTSDGNENILVSEVLAAFLRHAEAHYVRADGTPTNEPSEFKVVMRHVRELYGRMPAKDFGPLAFKAIRQKFIELDWCRSLVNQRANRIRHIFKWAVAEEMVPPAVFQALAAVAGLQRGRSKVRDSVPVEPVADDRVDATLPFLPRHVRGMVEFQRLTGCRPGEACSIRRADIDTGGTVWLYKPAQHKTAWRGKSRVIAIGPRAQVLLREFFTAGLEDYLFSPRAAVAEFHAGRSANRKTPKYASHMKRNAMVRKKAPNRAPTDVYDVTSYGHAIKRACAKAFPLPGDLAQHAGESHAAWWNRLTPKQQLEVKAHHKANAWHPNQLRHSHATKVRKAFGLEHAGAALGHAKMSATEVYAERDAGLALEVAAKLG